MITTSCMCMFSTQIWLLTHRRKERVFISHTVHVKELQDSGRYFTTALAFFLPLVCRCCGCVREWLILPVFLSFFHVSGQQQNIFIFLLPSYSLTVRLQKQGQCERVYTCMQVSSVALPVPACPTAEAGVLGFPRIAV